MPEEFKFQFAEIGFMTPEAEFIRKCFQFRGEISKLFEAEFFELEKGQVIVNKKNKEIKEIDSPNKRKWK